MHREVVSSNIRCCGWDPESKVMTVTFHTGKEYRFLDVGKGEYEGLAGATSVGKHFHDHIKSKYVGILKGA